MSAVSMSQVIDIIGKNLLRNIGKAAKANALATVPYQTGTLSDSIYSFSAPFNSVTLGATAPHAKDVEEGTQPVMVAGSWTGKWKRNKRRGKTVRGHTKTYANGKKPVLINELTNEWRTLGPSSGRPGTFFMKKAFEKAISQELEKILISMGATTRKP